MKRAFTILLWVAIGLAGAGALAAIAFERREPLNATWFVVAAVCTYLVAYRFYSSFLAAKVLALDDSRATPAERLEDGRDFVPTNKWVLLGHHFAAIAGPGPLGRSYPRRAVRLPTRNAVAHRGRCARRVRSGFHDFVLLDPARRKISGANGARGSEQARGHDRAYRRPDDHGYPARRGGARRCEGAEGIALGNVHARDDDPYCRRNGALSEVRQAGTSSGSFAGRDSC